MRLSPVLVKLTLNQFEAEAIPDNHPALPELNRMFGDHTFFVDEDGLHIVEPAMCDQDGAQTGQVVRLASWNDPERTSLAVHEPEAVDVVVKLRSRSPDAIH